MVHRALTLTNLHAEEEEGSIHVLAVVLALRFDHLRFLRRRLRADEGRVPERHRMFWRVKFSRCESMMRRLRARV